MDKFYKLKGKTALITGGTSGIGRAISLQLENQGVKLVLLTRAMADLSREESLVKQLDLIKNKYSIDLLILSAGVVIPGSVQEASIADYDYQHMVNLKSAIIITKTFLQQIIKSKGQIVFINSSAVNNPKKDTSFYAASKAGLKAFADSLRMEINQYGVRVISIFPGSTATPLTKNLSQRLKKNYNPELLLQPEDVSEMVVCALNLPLTAEVTDIFIRPLKK